MQKWNRPFKSVFESPGQLFILVGLFVSLSLNLSCSTVQPFRMLTIDPISDLTQFPQSIQEESLQSQLSSLSPLRENIPSSQAFHDHFFSVWKDSNPVSPIPKDNPSQFQECYGENYELRPKSWLGLQIENTKRPSSKVSISPFGMIIKPTDLRSLPTRQTCFASPLLAGEGYPFDHLQFTRLHAGVPIRVLQTSRDQAWVLVQTSYDNQGWIRKDDVLLFSRAEAKGIESRPIGALLHPPTRLLSEDEQEFYTTGTLFTLSKQKAWIPASQNKLKATALSDLPILEKPLSLESASDIAQAVKELIGKPYGWGSLNGNRDCSSLVQDFYALFHIALPPLSSQILNYGEKTDLSPMTLKEKKAWIKKNAIPFRTLLYLPGHITIYAGLYQGEPTLFQSMWAIKTASQGMDGRNLVAKSAITSLEPGKSHPFKKKTLLEQMTFMIDLIPSSTQTHSAKGT